MKKKKLKKDKQEVRSISISNLDLANSPRAKSPSIRQTNQMILQNLGSLRLESQNSNNSTTYKKSSNHNSLSLSFPNIQEDSTLSDRNKRDIEDIMEDRELECNGATNKSTSEYEDGKVKKEGDLMIKKRHKMLSRNQKSFCKIEAGSLLCYRYDKDQSTPTPKPKKITLKDACVKANLDSNVSIDITLSTKKIYQLEAASEQERKEWMEVLRKNTT